MNQRFFMCLLCLLPIGLAAQTVTVQGTIRHKLTNQPLENVSIHALKSGIGTFSDSSGVFSLPCSIGDVLRVSLVGFLAQEMPVSNDLNSGTLTFFLIESPVLPELVVTAIGLNKEQRQLTYAYEELSGESLSRARALHLGNGLSGQIAGLNVVGTATGPAGSTRLVLRGNRSISQDNQPLFVVDGLPIENLPMGQPNNGGSPDYGDGLISLNSADIESLTVLKGNAAAALYGSRASNGVILITTKKANGKGFGVEFGSNLTWESPLVRIRNQRQFGQGYVPSKPVDAGDASGSMNFAWGDAFDSSILTPQFDGIMRPWVYAGDGISDFYRTGKTASHSFALSAAAEKSAFRFAFTDTEVESIVPNSGFSRRNFTLNSSAKPHAQVDVQANLQYIIENGKNRSNVGGLFGNPNMSVAAFAPNVPLDALAGKNSDGSTPDGSQEMQVGFLSNPYWWAYRVSRTDERNRIIASLQTTFTPVQGIYVLGRAGIDRSDGHRFERYPRGTLYSPEGSLSEQFSSGAQVQGDIIVGMKKRTTRNFGYDVLVGLARSEAKSRYQGVSGNGIVLEGVDVVTNLKSISQWAGSRHTRTNSLYTSASFSYKSAFYLNATGRQDWFSTLSPGANGLFFPSLGAGFVFSEYWKMPTWLNFGKLRASWAAVGGDTQPYLLSKNYQINGQHLGSPLGQVQNQTIRPTNLSPLLSTEFEFGLDLRLFENQVEFFASAYRQHTTKDIATIQVPTSSGYGMALTNDGEMENLGLELKLDVRALKLNKFEWFVSLNAAKNRNRVLSLGKDVQSIQLAGTNNQALGFVHHDVGHPASVIKGFSYKKDDQGRIIFEKNETYRNGELVSVNYLPVQGDYRVLGNGVHDLTGGLMNSLRFGAFSLDVLMDFKFGAQLYSGTNAFLAVVGMSEYTGTARINGLHLDGVDTNGEPINFTYSVSDSTGLNDCFICHIPSVRDRISEPFLYDASFVKLRQVSLNFIVPEVWLRRLHVKEARVSAVGRNLALLYSKVPNVDPESSYLSGNGQGLEFFGVPPTRSIGFDVVLRF